MFPINPSTSFFLLLIGVFLTSALALRFGWRWRLPLLAVAIGVPAAFLWSDPPTGEYAELGYVVLVIPTAVTLFVGAFCGSIARFAKVAPTRFASGTVILAGVLSGLLLWDQFVPSACLSTPLHVKISNSDLFIPAEMQPVIEISNSKYLFGFSDRKSGTAQLCWWGRNGTRAVEADSVWITPAASYDEMMTTCKGGEPPAWCSAYAPDPFRHIGKFLIGPESELPFPPYYWDEGGSLKKDKQGNLTEGTLCLLPEEGSVTQCWVWSPFGQGSRLTVSTLNTDKIFTDMPVEKARDMIAKARVMTLAIIAR